ncbi:M20/M25/M40 family metallo-hydrolase [Micromonospora sp. NPDC005305]|uniref:M20 family metallopeptidase n=1 Tax=Micromonospora sp. NPDC005305 TaxID=3156875 RepID=UPI0033B2F9A5
MRTTPATSELNARIDAARDEEDALRLLRAAVAIPSVTGREEDFARYVAEELTGVCDEVAVDAFTAQRANVWARWGGSNDDAGKGLLFAGHLDTVRVTGWEEHWAGTSRQSPFGAAIVDGAVWGRGVGDLKAGITAVIAALQVLRRAGLAPAAPVTILFVADEESGEPDTGTSAGIRRALDPAGPEYRPLSADLAVYVEPTKMQVFTSHMGFFITDITLLGKSAYFGTPERGVDALRAADEVLRALWAYNDELGTRAEDDLVGSPSLLVTGISSGGYFAVPGECAINLIRKLTPAEDLDAARAELDAVIRAAVSDERVQVSTAYPAGRDHPVGGTALVTDPGLEAVTRLRNVVGDILPGRDLIAGAPYWSEGPFLADHCGIPTVYCAPGDISNCHTFDEHVEIQEFLAAVTVYARFIATHCGVRELR